VRTRLLNAARAAARNAYAPFSKFKVGAAVLAGSGKVYAGANVENSSYGLTICAERSAVSAAVSAGERRIKAALVYTNTKELTPPCGACRQVLFEFGPGMEVVVTNGRRFETHSLSALLPVGFRLKKR
jgi:cytidine deaminase